MEYIVQVVCEGGVYYFTGGVSKRLPLFSDKREDAKTYDEELANVKAERLSLWEGVSEVKIIPA